MTKDELHNTSKEQDNKPQTGNKDAGAGQQQRPAAPSMQPPAPRPPGMPPMPPTQNKPFVKPLTPPPAKEDGHED